jgi:hypothetical protein
MTTPERPTLATTAAAASGDLPYAADSSLNRNNNATTCATHIVDPASPLNVTPTTITVLNIAPPPLSADALEDIPPTNSKRADAMHSQEKASKTPQPPQTPQSNAFANI